MLESMSQESPLPPGTSRLHAGGKLSFRRRVPHVEEDTTGLPYVPLSEDPPRLSELVPTPLRRVEIEVGPGKGTFLLAATEAQPDAFVLGIEAAAGYARYAAERLLKAGRDNGLLLVDNAVLYLRDRVEEASVDRLHVYFPDPWPKRRHRKRRFFSPATIDVVHRVLVPGGHLLAATDNASYAGQICSLLGRHPALIRDEAEEERLAQAPPGHGFSPTNFETKYRREQRIIRRYAYRRV